MKSRGEHGRVVVAVLIACAACSSACEEGVRLPVATPAPGRITTLAPADANGTAGWWPSIAVAADGLVYVSSCEVKRGDLLLATRREGAWSQETVLAEGNVGKYTAVAVALDGSVGLAFYDQDQRLLRFAERRAPTDPWAFATVDAGEEIGMGAELRYDRDGRPVAFYYSATGELREARRNGAGAWATAVVDAAPGTYRAKLGIALRDEGYWVSYLAVEQSTMVLRVAKQRALGYAIETVSRRSGPGIASQLIVTTGKPSVLYLESSSLKLRRARPAAAGEWEAELLWPRVANVAAAQAQQGPLHVLYTHAEYNVAGAGKVFYAREAHGTWEHFALDEAAPTGEYLAAAVTPTGEPILAFFSGRTRALSIYDEPLRSHP